MNERPATSTHYDFDHLVTGTSADHVTERPLLAYVRFLRKGVLLKYRNPKRKGAYS